jgi:hypothetical protein
MGLSICYAEATINIGYIKLILQKKIQKFRPKNALNGKKT